MSLGGSQGILKGKSLKSDLVLLLQNSFICDNHSLRVRALEVDMKLLLTSHAGINLVDLSWKVWMSKEALSMYVFTQPLCHVGGKHFW